MYNTYDRSKHVIERRCKQIDVQLSEIENTIQAFQQTVLSKSIQHMH